MPAYTSFSGIDIIAVVNTTVIATLQGISYSITREKAPIYTFGSANPRSFSRGKRGLAGSMIFTLFDRSALHQLMVKDDGEFDYYAHEGEEYSLDTESANPWAWADSLTAATGPGGESIQSIKKHAEYMDQIMPFNITLIAQNEYGYAAWKAIIGVEILNEGGGLSVDDITNEEQTTYVARSATAWVPWSAETNAEGNNFSSNPVKGQTTIAPASADLISGYMNYLNIT